MARTELDPDDRMPLYRQLADLIRDQITSGRIPPRHAVPSKRTLRETHGVSARTIDDAMGILKDQGYLETEMGKGLYVRERRHWPR